MAYDITAIKNQVSLIDLFQRDGHELRRVGSAFFTPCPFHAEKTGSCKVEEHRFHCFGCGAGSDVIDYWELSRGISKKDAIAQIAAFAGLGPMPDNWTPPPPQPRAKKLEEKLPDPLTQSQRNAWIKCADALLANPKEVTRIAEWRGYRESTVRWAAERGLIGLKQWWNQSREAFLVERPEKPSGPFIPVSTHIRLGPNTQGNPKPKAMWHFDPKGCGAWPLVIGEPASADYIFIMEGQWDALALVDVMEWDTVFPTTAAIVAMRGAGSFHKFLQHYSLNEAATAFTIADADAAGASWFSAKGLVHQLSEKVRAVHAFWPGIPGADFNDLTKAGHVTRGSLFAILAPKLKSKRHVKPTGPTFYSWCKKHTQAPDPIGPAARFVANDQTRPSARARFQIWERHWRRLKLPQELFTALVTAFETYKSQSTTSN